MRALKTLSFYPVTIVGGLLLLVLRVFGWLCMLGFLLLWGLTLAGELQVSGWIVVSLGGAGLVALVLADLLTTILVSFNWVGCD